MPECPSIVLAVELKGLLDEVVGELVLDEVGEGGHDGVDDVVPPLCVRSYLHEGLNDDDPELVLRQQLECLKYGLVELGHGIDQQPLNEVGGLLVAAESDLVAADSLQEELQLLDAAG